MADEVHGFVTHAVDGDGRPRAIAEKALDLAVQAKAGVWDEQTIEEAFAPLAEIAKSTHKGAEITRE